LTVYIKTRISAYLEPDYLPKPEASPRHTILQPTNPCSNPAKTWRDW